MAEEKISVSIENVTIGKIWDKKMKDPASSALLAAVSSVVGKSSKVEVVNKVAKGANGYVVTLSIDELALDEKSMVLSTKTSGKVVDVSGTKKGASLSGKSKLPDANLKKIVGDVEFLMKSVGEGMGKDLKTFVENN
jgi:hypothetical protein